ncbi:MAG: ATP synthase subunit I [Fibrobacteria bacterium]
MNGNDAFPILGALVTGMVLGAIFFGGLWWTVRKALGSRSPAPLFLGSSLLRTAAVLAGFYFVSGGHWQRLLACLLGFALARPAVLRLTRRAEDAAVIRAKEGVHAAHP